MRHKLWVLVVLAMLLAGCDAPSLWVHAHNHSPDCVFFVEVRAPIFHEGSGIDYWGHRYGQVWLHVQLNRDFGMVGTTWPC